jgi:hypothetical protein
MKVEDKRRCLYPVPDGIEPDEEYWVDGVRCRNGQACGDGRNFVRRGRHKMKPEDRKPPWTPPRKHTSRKRVVFVEYLANLLAKTPGTEHRAFKVWYVDDEIIVQFDDFHRYRLRVSTAYHDLPGAEELDFTEE